MSGDGRVVIDLELGTKSFEEEIKQTEEYLTRLQRSYEKAMNRKDNFKNDEKAMANLRKEIEKTNNKLIDLNAKQEKLNMIDLNNAKSSIDGIGTSITGVIKKVGKWALAIFGIRSAYMFVRQAMSTLSQYNDQLATDVEYIRFAIATTLQPLIEAIIKLVYQLLGLLNSVAKTLFGIDLFANASAKSFKKANKSAGELKKTLAGFDEMNVLNADGSTGAIGGVSPSFDLSQMGDTDLSGILKLLDNIKDLFNKAFDSIANNIIKVFRGLGFSEEFLAIFKKSIDGIKEMINGLIDFLVGNVKIVVGFLTGNTDLVKEGFNQAIQGIYTSLVGYVKLMINSFLGLKQLIFDIFLNVVNFIYNKVIKPIGDWFINLSDNITNTITNAVRNINNWFNKIPEFLQGIRNRVVEIFRNMGTSVSSVIGNAFKNVINAVLTRAEIILNKPIATINSLISKINEIPGISLGKLQTFKLPRLAKGGILNMPGRGVDYYGANIAEKAPEAVIPFTDEQVMDRLGQSIARHMVVNLMNINQFNGRIISRELRRVQNNQDFAFNR
jgi:uncharacterized protein YjbJ (UPF0337 family)